MKRMDFDKKDERKTRFVLNLTFKKKHVSFCSHIIAHQCRHILREFRREILIQRELIHPNIIKLYCISMDPIAMIMELADYGNLLGMLLGELQIAILSISIFSYSDRIHSKP